MLKQVEEEMREAEQGDRSDTTSVHSFNTQTSGNQQPFSDEEGDNRSMPQGEKNNQDQVNQLLTDNILGALVLKNIESHESQIEPEIKDGEISEDENTINPDDDDARKTMTDLLDQIGQEEIVEKAQQQTRTNMQDVLEQLIKERSVLKNSQKHQFVTVPLDDLKESSTKNESDAVGAQPLQ